MKTTFLSILAFILCSPSFAQAEGQRADEIPTLTEYFRTAPVYIVGRIRFEKAHRLFHDEVAGIRVLEGSLQPNHDLNLWLSKTELRIRTKGGLRVSVAGVPVTVTKLNYSNKTGVVEVESSILGFDAGNFYAEKRMAEEIKNRFQPKLQEAFARLVLIRQQKNLGSAGDALNDVIHVFSPPPKPGAKRGTPLPTFVGEISLITIAPSDQSVRVGKLVADIQEGDALESSVLLRVPSRSKAQIRGLMFSSSKGLVLRKPEGSKHDVKTATLSGFSATENYGFQLDATNGADAIISGTQLLIGLIRIADRGVMPTEESLSGVRGSTLIQNVINAKAKNGLREFVQNNRADLLKAGATPELLNALEVDHPPVGRMPFTYPGNE